MIIKCQVSVSVACYCVYPKGQECTQSDGSANKKQSKDLCGGERLGKHVKLNYFHRITGIDLHINSFDFDTIC